MENLVNKTAVALQGFIPIRKDPYERSEMLSQVLFGEKVLILDDEARWLYIRLENDAYEGWIDKKCIHVCSDTYEVAYLLTGNNTKIMNLTKGHTVSLPVASSIPELSKNRFTLCDNTFEISDTSIISPIGKASLEALVEAVRSVPYIWGGRCGFGFDCSGLTQFLSRANGVSLPRDASDQSAVGHTLSFMSEAKTGDLAFFDDTDGMIHHVGMMLGSDKIVHASGTVRIDKIDHQGIYNEELGTYTHKLRVLKRINNV